MVNESILFIGWGEVAERFYQPYFMSMSFYDYSFTILELRDYSGTITLKNATLVTSWNNSFLKEKFQNDGYSKVFILTPPQTHIDILQRCCALLEKSSQKCDIYIEKPISFDSNVATAQLDQILPVLESAGHKVRIIDHYAGKWCVRWLKKYGMQVIEKIKPLTKLSFISLESRDMIDSTVFKNGYATEHGVHGWTIFTKLFPEFFSSKTNLLDKPVISHRWRYIGAPEICNGETSFSFFYTCYVCDLGKISVVLSSGKTVGEDQKGILIEGQSGKIYCSISNDRITFVDNNGEFSNLGTDEVMGNKDAYEFIFNHIFAENASDFETPTLSVGESLWTLKAIELGLDSLVAIKEIEKGTLPELLKMEKNKTILDIL